MEPIYKRILLKLSGEGMMGSKSFGVDAEVVESLAKQIKDVHSQGVGICIVVGGGNIFRGAKEASQNLSRSVADQIGMLATVMNGLFLSEALKKIGVDVRLLSGLGVDKVCEPYIYGKAISYIERGRVLIFAGGTGNPYFTTDTGAALRAVEMHCDVILKATQVDGVYTADPKKDVQAKKYDEISYDEVINKQLKVMDLTAVSLAKENKIPMVVFEQKGSDSIMNAVCGKGEFTIVK